MPYFQGPAAIRRKITLSNRGDDPLWAEAAVLYDCDPWRGSVRQKLFNIGRRLGPQLTDEQLLAAFVRSSCLDSIAGAQ